MGRAGRLGTQGSYREAERMSAWQFIGAMVVIAVIIGAFYSRREEP